MPNVIPVLNEHIRRLARREVKAQTIRTKKQGSKYRRAIAMLKREIRGLTSRIKYLEKHGGARAGAGVQVQADPSANLRFRVDGLRTHRKKLGISAKDYGELVGVSGLTVYNWEAGKSRPRRRQLAALAQVRGMGKREALKRLDGKK